MTSPLANVYRLIDDSGFAAGPPGGNTGSGSGQPLAADFTAPTLAAAFTVAWVICSALQRPGRLVPVGGAAPYTLVTGSAANIAITAVPSGVGY